METAVNHNILTNFQMQMLEATSKIESDDEMIQIRDILSRYFAEKAQCELDKLWENGTINDSVIETWKSEHMRSSN